MDASEPQLLLNHLSKVSKGDILLLDRGYPSKYLFSLLMSKGIHFVSRMASNWLPVKDFKESNQQDIELMLEVPEGDLIKYKALYSSMKRTFRCRLVKVTDEYGQQQILCTSLFEKNKYTLADLADMYQMRWGIEESYKLFKARVQVEAFSGKTAHAVKQDIYAKIMMMSLCAALAFPIEEKVIKEYKAAKKKGLVKHLQKINRTFAYWSTKGLLINMFIKRFFKKSLSVFDQQIQSNTELDRPGRKNPREKKPPRLYQMNYKDV
jgi:hypothetical protein